MDAAATAVAAADNDDDLSMGAHSRANVGMASPSIPDMHAPESSNLHDMEIDDGMEGLALSAENMTVQDSRPQRSKIKKIVFPLPGRVKRARANSTSSEDGTGQNVSAHKRLRGSLVSINDASQSIRRLSQRSPGISDVIALEDKLLPHEESVASSAPSSPGYLNAPLAVREDSAPSSPGYLTVPPMQEDIAAFSPDYLTIPLSSREDSAPSSPGYLTLPPMQEDIAAFSPDYLTIPLSSREDSALSSPGYLTASPMQEDIAGFSPHYLTIPLPGREDSASSSPGYLTTPAMQEDIATFSPGFLTIPLNGNGEVDPEPLPLPNLQNPEEGSTPEPEALSFLPSNVENPAQQSGPVNALLPSESVPLLFSSLPGAIESSAGHLQDFRDELLLLVSDLLPDSEDLDWNAPRQDGSGSDTDPLDPLDPLASKPSHQPNRSGSETSPLSSSGSSFHGLGIFSRPVDEILPNLGRGLSFPTPSSSRNNGDQSPPALEGISSPARSASGNGDLPLSPNLAEQSGRSPDSLIIPLSPPSPCSTGPELTYDLPEHANMSSDADGPCSHNAIELLDPTSERSTDYPAVPPLPGDPVNTSLRDVTVQLDGRSSYTHGDTGTLYEPQSFQELMTRSDASYSHYAAWTVSLVQSAPWDIARHPPMQPRAGEEASTSSAPNNPDSGDARLDAVALDARQVQYDMKELEVTRDVIRQVRTMRGMVAGVLRGPYMRRFAEVQGINMVFEGTAGLGSHEPASTGVTAHPSSPIHVPQRAEVIKLTDGESD